MGRCRDSDVEVETQESSIRHQGQSAGVRSGNVEMGTLMKENQGSGVEW